MILKETFVIVLNVARLIHVFTSGCSVNFTESSGFISSSNYPNEKYDNNLDCTFTIKSPASKPITLIYMDFNVGYYEDCSDDYVQIKDDETDLGYFCGNINPDPIIALSGTLVVYFHSNSFWRFKGFKAIYNDSEECTHVLRSDEGTIESPEYPQDIPNSHICLFLIQSLHSLPINLTFTRFVGDSTTSCTSNYIIVKDSMNRKGNRFGPYCELPEIPVIATGTIFLILISSTIDTSPQFSAVYHEHAFLDCNGHLNYTHGQIQSPNYPENYGNDKICTYRLTSANSRPINLTFLDFKLEEQSDSICSFDYVEIFNENRQSFGKLCGSIATPFNLTLPASIIILFKSDNSRTFKGFDAVFTEIPATSTNTVTVETVSATTTTIVTVDTTSIRQIDVSTKRLDVNVTQELTVNGENDVLVPTIAGTVTGILVIAVIVAVICFLRIKTQRKRPQSEVIDNTVLYINVGAIGTENRSFGDLNSNDSAVYCNTKNFHTDGNLVTLDTKNETALEPQHDEFGYAAILKENLNNIAKYTSETDSQNYVEQNDAYNILNIHPSKIESNNIYDRSMDDVYDSAVVQNINDNNKDTGAYDLTPDDVDHEYDTTAIISSSIVDNGLK